MTGSKTARFTPVDLKTGRRYALYNVIAGFLAFFFMMGIPALMMPTLYTAIMEDMGWTRTEVTTFSTFKFMAGAVGALFIGSLVDKFGIKTMGTITAVMTGIGMAAFWFVDTLSVYYSVGFFLGLGAVATTITLKVLVSRWYFARQGFMIGITMLGAGVAGTVTPLAAEIMQAQMGWRMTIILMSLGIWFLFIPTFLFFSRSTPEEFGLSAEEIDPGKIPLKPNTEGQPGIRDVIRMRSFWIFVAANFLIGIAEQGMQQHQKIFLQNELMLSGILAASGYTWITIFGNVGKVGFGWVYDRFSVRGVAFCWLTIGLGILSVIPVGGILTFMLFAVVRGTSHGGNLVDIPVLVRHCYGTKALAKAFSFMYAAYMVGAGIGSRMVGMIADAYGTYIPAFILIGFLCFVAAAMIVSIKPVYWMSPKEREKQAAIERSSAEPVAVASVVD